eukprot:113610_1
MPPSVVTEAIKKPVFAIDLDEVLCSTTIALNQFHNDTYGTSYVFSDYNSYYFGKTWGNCSDDECFEKFEAFYKTDYFRQAKPIPRAFDCLTELSRHFDLYVVTARAESIAVDTRKWIGEHFPNIFKDILFGNHFCQAGRDRRSKAEMCQSIGARVHIDDHTAYCIECAGVLDEVILFNLNGTYNWSKTDSNLPENVTKLESWEAVKDFMMQFHAKLSAR